MFMNEDIGEALMEIMEASLPVNSISFLAAFKCDDPQTRNLPPDVTYLPDVSGKRYS